MTTTTSASEAEAAPGYYGHPIVKAHVWKGYIGWYFFTGGLAGASSILAAAADLSGRPDLARHARRAALIGLVPSPALLVADLGRPKRFMNMLRVVKPTSPMSIGSWLLAVYGPAAAAAAVLDHVHVLPRVRRVSTVLAGTVGAAVATYTAVLVADTATPVWHEARNDLPPLFAASAGASGGAATAALAALSGRPSRAAGLIGAVGATTEIALSELMRRRLGDLDTYGTDPVAHRLTRASTLLSGLGAIGLVAGRRSRPAIVGASAAVAAGSACLRLSVLRAGKASADDPRSVLRTAAAPPISTSEQEPGLTTRAAG